MQNQLWNNNLIQFARLIAEISATQDHLDLPALAESMDLEVADVNTLFDRANEVWEASKTDSASTQLTAMPDAVKAALDHVRANYPDVTQVFFDTDGRWLFCGEAFQAPDFDEKDIDIGLLEDAADAVAFLPAAFSLPRADLSVQITQAAKTAYEHAKQRWDDAVANGRFTECLIESSDIFHGIDLAGLPSTDAMENAVEDALTERGYYTLAAEAFEAVAAQNADAKLAKVVRDFVAKVDEGWAIHASHIDPLRNAPSPEALRIAVAAFLAKVDSGWAIHESNLKPMRDALASTQQ